MAYHIKKRGERGKKMIDVCGDNLAWNIILYTLPLMASGILQVLFNAADAIIVGRFAENGDTALAAVGSTGALINLIINLRLGLSVGTSVAVAHAYGSGDKKGVYDTWRQLIGDSYIHPLSSISIILYFILCRV